MMRTTIAVTLAVGSQAFPLARERSSLLAGAPHGEQPVQFVPTHIHNGIDHFTPHPNTYCPKMDELGSGNGNNTRMHIDSVEACADSCLDVDICTSFEWTSTTKTCTRSTTCRMEHNDYSKAEDGTDLYVKNHPHYDPYYKTVCEDRDFISVSYPNASDGCSIIKGGGCSALNACGLLCTADVDCAAFQFKHETGLCELSATCSKNTSKTNQGGWNMYVKATGEYFSLLPRPPPAAPVPMAPPPPTPPPLTHSQKKCGPTCTNEVWKTTAHNKKKDTYHTCGERIKWRTHVEFGNNWTKGCVAVGEKYSECSPCK